MIATPNQFRDDRAGERSVRHAVARITGHNKNIVVIGGITTDETETIDWFHDLSRPAEDCFTRFWETRACPFFKPLESHFEIIRLSGFVILAADDEEVVLRIAICESHVMIR